MENTGPGPDSGGKAFSGARKSSPVGRSVSHEVAPVGPKSRGLKFSSAASVGDRATPAQSVPTRTGRFLLGNTLDTEFLPLSVAAFGAAHVRPDSSHLFRLSVIH